MAYFGFKRIENGTLNEKEVLILNTILENNKYTYAQIAEKTSISRRTVTRIVASLVEKQYLLREGSKRDGKWIVIK